MVEASDENDLRKKSAIPKAKRSAAIRSVASSVRRALASKLRGPGFKSWPGAVGGPVTIIMRGARPGWKLALS